MSRRRFPPDELCPGADVWSRLSLMMAEMAMPGQSVGFTYAERFPAFGSANDSRSVMGLLRQNRSQFSLPNAFLNLERLKSLPYYLGPWNYAELALVYNRRLTQPSVNLELEDVYPPAICLLLCIVWAAMVFHRRFSGFLGLRRRSLIMVFLGLLFVVLKHYLKAKMVRFYNRPVAINHGILDLNHLWKLCEQRQFRLLYDSDAIFGKLNASSEDTAEKLARFATAVREDRHIERLLNSSRRHNVLLTDNHKAMQMTSSKLFLRATFIRGQMPFLLVAYSRLRVRDGEERSLDDAGPTIRQLRISESRVLRAEYERRVSFQQGKSLWLNSKPPRSQQPKPLSLAQMRVALLTIAALLALDLFSFAAEFIGEAVLRCVYHRRWNLIALAPQEDAATDDWMLY